MTDLSFWEATAISGPSTGPLVSDASYDVVIIGAGYCGLNAALELAHKGRSICVIDAQPLGAGASGRAGGFVSGRFRMSPATVRRKFGDAALGTLQRISGEAVQQVRSNVKEYDLVAARLVQHGSVTAAMNARHFNRLVAAQRAADKSTYNPTAEVEILDWRQIAEQTGSNRFAGGLLSPGGLGLHPLNYCLGLAKAALDAGTDIYSDTPALEIREDGSSVVVSTARGKLRAKKVIVATNAYSGLTQAARPLAKGVIPFRSAAIATQPLTPQQLEKVLPGERLMFDTKRLLRWFRIVDGRLLVGGRGAGSPAADEDAYRHMRACMVEIFPDLRDTEIEFKWSGFVGLTLDGLPHVGPVSPKIVIAGGCNGNGIAVASLLGRYAAKFALDEEPDVGVLHTRHFRTLPLHRFAAPGVRIATKGYQILDMLGV